MNREERNVGSIILFFVIIFIIFFGGFYLITHNKPKNKVEDNSQNEVKSIKIDDKKSYIYYSNEESITETVDIKNINININSDDAKNTQNKLNSEKDNVKSSIIKDSEGKVKTANAIDYSFVESTNYLSLIVSKYTYNSDETLEDIKDSELTFYVFDLKSGKLVNNHDIMREKAVNDQDIRSKIRSEISNEENVDIDLTLSQEYHLTISKTGKVVINTIVKTNNSSYNIAIEMD